MMWDSSFMFTTSLMKWQTNFLSRSFENYCLNKNLKRPPKIKRNWCRPGS